MTTHTFKIVTKEQAQKYLSLVAKFETTDAPACEHGHFGCAAWENGPCSDEVAGEFDLNDE